jgi:hypothetical protein
MVVAIFFVAMVCFFFTFHPGGVEGVSSPQGILQWLFGAVANTTGETTATDAALLSNTTTDYPGFTNTSESAQQSTVPQNVTVD